MAVPLTAHLVGQVFVYQYYNVLHQWPHMVYRFYTDASRLTRAEAGPDAEVICARSQVEIHNTVMSMGYEECQAEIVTVDSSESIRGCVLVLVTGVMHMHRTNGRRNFVQSFLLAPQERGYYVLNDIFRYQDKDSRQVHKMVNGSIDTFERLQIGSAEADGNRRNASLAWIAEEGAPDVDRSPMNALKAEQAGGEDRAPHISDMLSERLGFADQDSHRSEDGFSDKKSYASILRFQRDSSTGSGQQATSSSLYQPANKQPFQHSTAGLLANPQTTPTVDANVLSNSELGEVKFVYIGNLPENVTESQLEGDLVKLGCSRPSSVILKNHKDGGVYAFVDFEDSTSALNAIEVSPVMIGGRRCYIQERRSTYTGGRGRGNSRGTLSSVGARGRGPDNAWPSSLGAEVNGEGNPMSRARGARCVRGGYGGSNTRV